ncbi:MAG TPA: glycosyltransferase [Thermoanaerobaculia bacterium]
MPRRLVDIDHRGGQADVIPVYNEEPNLPPLAGEIRRTMRALGRPYEVLLVDDGSTDGSLATMIRLANQDPAVRVIRQARNAGQSAAAGGESSLGDQQIDLAEQFHVKSDDYLGRAHGQPPRVIAALV